MRSKLWKQAYDRLFSIYGKNPPELCLRRLEEEKQELESTDAIELFTAMGRIREEARHRNTAVIITGTINSCFAAWLVGGTVVNPLPPHYVCPNCGKSEFVSSVKDGFDLPPKKCSCGATLSREGHSIPYQGFAESTKRGIGVHICVSTKFKPIAVSTARGFYEGDALLLPVKMDYNLPPGWEEYIVIKEQNRCPPLSENGIWETDVTAYLSWYKNESTFMFESSPQLDCLEALIKETCTLKPATEDLINTPVIRSLYKEIYSVPPFITDYILGDTQITCDKVMRISGASRSVGMWEDYGSNAVRSGLIDFCDLPAYREDVLDTFSNALIQNNISDISLAVQVMDNARKGKYPDWKLRKSTEAYFSHLGVPAWYFECLSKTGYLFPKGSSVELLLIDLTFEWYRINYPAEFAQCTAKIKD